MNAERERDPVLGPEGRPIDEEEDEVSSCLHCGHTDALVTVEWGIPCPLVVFCGHCKRAAYVTNDGGGTLAN